jgi:hypothetical protein
MERARESGIVESPMFPPVSLAFCTSVTSLIMQGAVEQFDQHFNSPVAHGLDPPIAQCDFWRQSHPTPDSNVRDEATSGATASTFELVCGVSQIRVICITANHAGRAWDFSLLS